ncbi:MAG TPA: hypothetical protein VGF55_28855 [Gemmataceae bacterium]
MNDQPHAWQLAPRFRESDFVARPQRPPRLRLPALKAARAYHAARAAAAEARGRLVEEVLRRADSPAEALAALNHLAESFGLPPFTAADLA